MELTPELIEEKYKELPKDLREALSGKHVEESVFTIGKRKGLHIDKITTLLNQVRYFILGFTSPQDFKTNITRELDIPGDQAEEIVEDLNQEIFMPVRESLQAIHLRDNPTEVDPATNQAKNFINQRLNQTSGTEQKTTDYSIRREERHDPYREPIE